MKKFFGFLFAFTAASLAGCGNCDCPVTSIASPEDTGADPLETGAYVFRVKDASGSPIAGAEFSIDVTRNLPMWNCVAPRNQKFTGTSDADGFVKFELSQIDNVCNGEGGIKGGFGLLSVNEVESRTPAEYITRGKDSFGNDTVDGLYYVDSSGGVYTGNYSLSGYGEYHGLYLGYTCHGERYSLSAVHQTELVWKWERTINGLFSKTVQYQVWDEDLVDYAWVGQEGGRIQATMTKAPEGYQALSEPQVLAFEYVDSGDAYDRYWTSANYVLVSASDIVLQAKA